MSRPTRQTLLRAGRLGGLSASAALAATAALGYGAAIGVGRTLLPHALARTAPADTFHATITGADGNRSGDRGGATVLLARGAAGPGGTVAVSITFQGEACHGASHCVRIGGKLAGRMAPQSSLADVGRSYRIEAAGALTPFGHVTAIGIAAGPGFIRSGHAQLNLTLAARGGSVTIHGISPPVPGFTHP
jgi:hypothetical protein